MEEAQRNEQTLQISLEKTRLELEAKQGDVDRTKLEMILLQKERDAASETSQRLSKDFENLAQQLQNKMKLLDEAASRQKTNFDEELKRNSREIVDDKNAEELQRKDEELGDVQKRLEEALQKKQEICANFEAKFDASTSSELKLDEDEQRRKIEELERLTEELKQVRYFLFVCLLFDGVGIFLEKCANQHRIQCFVEKGVDVERAARRSEQRTARISLSNRNFTRGKESSRRTKCRQVCGLGIGWTWNQNIFVCLN